MAELRAAAVPSSAPARPSEDDTRRAEYRASRVTHWDRVARSLDRLDRWNRGYHHRLRQRYGWLIPAGQRVLEMGCGAGDLLAALPPDTRFDFIVSNPPYIGQTEMPKLAREVRDHEPHLALVGGAVGVEVIQRLVPQAAERLRLGGWLVLEISPFIDVQVRQIFVDDAGWEAPIVSKDLAQLARVVKSRRRDAA